MKKTIILCAALILIGAGCNKAVSTNLLNNPAKPKPNQPPPANSAQLACNNLLKGNGQSIYTGQDAANQFGGDWQETKPTPQILSTCQYRLTTGQFGKNNFKSIYVSKDAQTFLEHMFAVASGAPLNNSDAPSTLATLVPNLGDQAIYLTGPFTPKLIIKINDRYISIQSSQLNLYDSVKIAQIIITNLK